MFVFWDDDTGGQIKSFSSLCGGLPAPEAANNPLMYKFSWSPLGVLRAAQNSSRYLENGSVVDVDGNDLLVSARPLESAFPTLSLEHLPNRDSLPYGDVYGISGDDPDMIYRGTLRYAGWSRLMEDFRKVGLTTKLAGETDVTSLGDGSSWRDLMEALHSREGNAAPSAEARRCLEWLGCYSEDEMVDTSAGGSVLEAFCALLQKRLAFGEGERDMVAMFHEFGVTFEDENRPDEVRTSELLVYGSDAGGDTAMAKTVGLTIAVGAELVLGGAGQGGGVLVPTSPEFYNPGLDLLAKEGLHFNEETRVL